MTETDDNPVSRLSISVVSHGQAELLSALLRDLAKFCLPQDELLITLNIEEPLTMEDFSFRCPVKVVRNKVPLGFGANHNQAFSLSRGRYFCVLNPDIRLYRNPFPGLLSRMEKGAGVIAPRVVNSAGRTERSARRFPTPLSILKKAVLGESRRPVADISTPDWVAGMIMVFPADVFRALNGFNERYFLYYEDVDICARLKLAGYSAVLCWDITVQHDAQWKSHSDPAYRKYHLKSMARYFLSMTFLRLQMRKFITKLKQIF